jgi:hypothetical protein
MLSCRRSVPSPSSLSGDFRWCLLQLYLVRGSSISAASTKSVIVSVSLMSCESIIPPSSACFLGPGPLWTSVACFALSIYAHYPCRLACFADDFFGL